MENCAGLVLHRHYNNRIFYEYCVKSDPMCNYRSSNQGHLLPVTTAYMLQSILDWTHRRFLRLLYTIHQDIMISNKVIEASTIRSWIVLSEKKLVLHLGLKMFPYLLDTPQDWFLMLMKANRWWVLPRKKVRSHLAKQLEPYFLQLIWHHHNIKVKTCAIKGKLTRYLISWTCIYFMKFHL